MSLLNNCHAGQHTKVSILKAIDKQDLPVQPIGAPAPFHVRITTYEASQTDSATKFLARAVSAFKEAARP
jgi:hypothetical protein